MGDGEGAVARKERRLPGLLDWEAVLRFGVRMLGLERPRGEIVDGVINAR